MSKKYKYKIGDWVEFKKYIKVNSMDDERFLCDSEMSKPITGQVCGAVIRFIGTIHTESWDYHKESAYLIKKKAIVLYQIKQGMTNVPYEVKEEDIEKIDSLVAYYGKLKLPWRYIAWSIHDKKRMSDDVVDAPRDSKGRFE